MSERITHTPGPWAVFKTENGWSIRPAATQQTIEGSMVGYTHEKIVGDVCGFNWRGTKHQANARLIAAAPEMLDALKDAKEFLQCECHDEPERSPCVGCTIIAAIAKAEGV